MRESFQLWLIILLPSLGLMVGGGDSPRDTPAWAQNSHSFQSKEGCAIGLAYHAWLSSLKIHSLPEEITVS